VGGYEWLSQNERNGPVAEAETAFAWRQEVYTAVKAARGAGWAAVEIISAQQRLIYDVVILVRSLPGTRVKAPKSLSDIAIC
jgi:hypothetical protein